MERRWVAVLFEGCGFEEWCYWKRLRVIGGIGNVDVLVGLVSRLPAVVGITVSFRSKTLCGYRRYQRLH